MKNIIISSILIIILISIYPKISNTSTSGSPGGMTGSPADGASCTTCHYAGVGNSGFIESNIPLTGYIPNQTYTLTLTINQPGINKFGFEITSEEDNFGSAKTGTFLLTNSNETKFVNNNNSVTHKASGTSGNGGKTWEIDWQAPNSGTGTVNFYAAFIAANSDGQNSGDTWHSSNISITEDVVNSINEISKENQIIFNYLTKEINVNNLSEINVYSINGKQILNKKNTTTISLKDIKPGIYLIDKINNNKKINKIISIN